MGKNESAAVCEVGEGSGSLSVWAECEYFFCV